MNFNILLGITGSISSYKICDLIRNLKKRGNRVRVVLTPFAERFISKTVWEALTGERAFADWEGDPLAHINLARWADVFMIAPCSINTLSKMALGVADNLLTSTFLAYEGSVLISPVANPVMYSKSVVREHIERLRREGHIIIEPEYGLMVCEEEGIGKLPSVERLEEWIYWKAYPKRLEGKRILITCGATREYMDDVRFISNESSGEMGFSLARVLRWSGADVRVIAGFTTAREPYDIPIKRIVSAEDMLNAVKEWMDWADVIIMNAAVSDFKPVRRYEGKLKKDKIDGCIEIERTVDILEYIGRNKGSKLLIGFALETENMVEEAKRKLKLKGADYIIANPSRVMGSVEYEGIIIGREGVVKSIRAEDKLQASFEIEEFLAGILLNQRDI